MKLKTVFLLFSVVAIALTGCSTSADEKPKKKKTEKKEEREEDDSDSGYSRSRHYRPYGWYHRHPGPRRVYRPW